MLTFSTCVFSGVVSYWNVAATVFLREDPLRWGTCHFQPIPWFFHSSKGVSLWWQKAPSSDTRWGQTAIRNILPLRHRHLDARGLHLLLSIDSAPVLTMGCTILNRTLCLLGKSQYCAPNCAMHSTCGRQQGIGMYLHSPQVLFLANYSARIPVLLWRTMCPTFTLHVHSSWTRMHSNQICALLMMCETNLLFACFMDCQSRHAFQKKCPSCTTMESRSWALKYMHKNIMAMLLHSELRIPLGELLSLNKLQKHHQRLKWLSSSCGYELRRSAKRRAPHILAQSNTNHDFMIHDHGSSSSACIPIVSC